MTLSDLGCAAVTIALLLFAMVVRPVRARCRPGWYVNGVRPSGVYECRPVLGRPEDDLLDAVRRTVLEQDQRAIRGRVYCTGGATPRQDGAAVWCQR